MSKNHYVNNAEFVKALEEYKLRLKDNPEERVPEYIGVCIYDIANRFASKPNFYNYSYREEMVSDGIENCLQYLTNFDSSKSSNAFAYFTQICYYAFIRRIAREKKQSYIKHKLVMEMPFEAFELQEFDDNEMSQNFVSFIQSNSSFDFEAYEKSIAKKPKKNVKSPLDEFLGEEDNNTI